MCCNLEQSCYGYGFTWVYLSIKVRAFGTLWSPRWTTDEPIQDPNERCARLKISLIAFPMRGAD